MPATPRFAPARPPTSHRSSLPAELPHVPSVILPEGWTTAKVRKSYRALLDQGCPLRPSGTAQADPDVLLHSNYLPRFSLRVFGWTWFLSELMSDEGLGVFIAYVTRAEPGGSRTAPIFPRILYKDSSLMWRVASHFVHDEHEYWIGKGAVRREERADGPYLSTLEETTNLPLEVQGALDQLSRKRKRRVDNQVVERVLRQAPSGRMEPYRDFTGPRNKAAARGQLNGGKPVARFRKKGDPESLSFTRGFEPDFEHGLAGFTQSGSRFFGGQLEKHRILSTNRRIQYMFMATPAYAWVNPPQT